MTKYSVLIFIFFTNLLCSSHAVAKEYVIGGDYDYAPFSFIDTNGEASGLDVDVLKAIFNKSDLKINFQLSNWDHALSALQSGKVDILSGIIFSKERAKLVDFTIPIHTEYYSIFIRSNLEFKDISSLYNYRPIVLDKDISIDHYLIPMGLFQNYVLVKSLSEAFSRIESGLADYVIAPNLLGLDQIKKNEFKNIQLKGQPIIPSIYCIAVKKGNTPLLNLLNNGISKLQKSGELVAIQTKWDVHELEYSNSKRITKIITLVSLAIIFILILVFIVIGLLRKQVKSKTKSLYIKNQELEKSEEKFRTITEKSSDIIWHLDSNFELTYISPSDERIRGFKMDEIMGDSLFSILKPEGIKMLMDANEKRLIDLSNGIVSPPTIYELEELCKDGSWIWIEATTTAYLDEHGKITGYHGVSRDISERKKAEQLLKKQENQLRELVFTKDKLFSIIAHDLKSPFNAILGFSELLIGKVKQQDPVESETYLKIIHSTAKNTLNLLDNLLDWANAQTGQLIFKPRKVDLSALVGEIFQISNPMAKIKNITLKYTQTDDLVVYADVNMLKTILRNLISNAIKFTDSEGEILISAVKNQNNMEITVSDNGIGMSEDIQRELFKMDANVTTNGTANEKGSGIGLILCKEFVEKHGGQIWIESIVGKGSDFKFSLPLK